MTETSASPKPLALIAEDSRMQAKILESRLKQAGYDVAVAGDGGVALELRDNGSPTSSSRISRCRM